MNNGYLLRIGAVAAVTGAAGQLVASVLEPDWGGDPGKAVRVVADNGLWTGDRLLDLIGVFLTIGALTVVGRSFAGGRGMAWARAGQPFLLLMGALGTAAVLTGATLKDVADAWVDAAPQAKEPYLAAFDTTARVTEALFFGAFVAMGLYLAALAASILVGRVYARWIGWAAAAAGALVLTGDLLVLASDRAFVVVLAGFVLFMAVLVALGMSLWRRASTESRTGTKSLGDRPRTARDAVPALRGELE